MPRSTTNGYAATLVTAAVVSLGALTSCAGESAEPRALDTAASGTPSSADAPTATSSPTSTPSRSASHASPPTLPPEARGTTRASAGPFVRYWVDTLNYATRHSRPLAIQPLSRRSCVACRSLSNVIRKVRDGGGRLNGKGWTVRRTEVLPIAQPLRPQVRAFITFEPQTVIEKHGAAPLHFDGGRTVYTFNLVPSAETWAVAGVIGVHE